jgi:hypothetical protein
MIAFVPLVLNLPLQNTIFFSFCIHIGWLKLVERFARPRSGWYGKGHAIPF